MENLVVLDCEVYPNMFLVAFKNVSTGKVVKIEARGKDSALSDEDRSRLKAIMIKRKTFGFNSINYDLPIIFYALKGKTCQEICDLSDTIINEGLRGWQACRQFDIVISQRAYHFDIQEVAPGVRVSLKLYGGRMHSSRLQDLPIAPGTMLTEKQMDETADYCVNDLDTTIDLYNKVADRVDLRVQMSETYGVDLKSKSDAQIAEAVIKVQMQRKTPGKRFRVPTYSPDTTFRYPVPDFIKFETEQLQDMLEVIRTHDFKLDGRGSIKLPDVLKSAKINMGISNYQLGVGGLHSNEKRQAIIPNENQILADRDVASYYPNMIANLGLTPRQLGKSFLSVYRKILVDRIRAKRRSSLIKKEIKDIEKKLEAMTSG